jgi:DNA-binding transcriptional regulator YdaS (Cro superfamily)
MPRRKKKNPDHAVALATLLGVSPRTLQQWLDAAAKSAAGAKAPRRGKVKRRRKRRAP